MPACLTFAQTIARLNKVHRNHCKTIFIGSEELQRSLDEESGPNNSDIAIFYHESGPSSSYQSVILQNQKKENYV